MTMRPPTRLLAAAKIAAVTLTSAALTLTLAGPAAAHPRHDSDRGTRPERIALPNGFQPEGIAIDKGSRAYLGSRTNGDIISVDLRTGEPTGPPAIVPIAVHTVRIEGDDVYVALSEES